MALEPQDLRALDKRAQEVGQRVGLYLRFHVLGNPEYVVLAAGPNQTCVMGPSKLADLAAYEVDFALDGLERGDKQIIHDGEMLRLVDTPEELHG